MQDVKISTQGLQMCEIFGKLHFLYASHRKKQTQKGLGVDVYNP